MNKRATTKAEVHRELNLAAAAIANGDKRLQDFWFSRFDRVNDAATANMFRPAIGSTLGLEYDDAWLENPLLEDKQEFVETMREIAVDAIRKALVKRKDLFVGVIVGEAREGRNYFGGSSDDASRPPDMTLF